MSLNLEPLNELHRQIQNSISVGCSRTAADMAILIPDEPKAINPEWLESKGFAKVTRVSMENWEYFPAPFDVNYDEDYDLCYLEKKLDRKQFCIVLTPSEYDDARAPFYSFDIYIQANIGCGFVAIPNQFSEMTEYHFSLLYEAIRRKKLC